MSRIIWIRHGEHVNDVLTPTGCDQIKATVQSLLAEYGRPIAIYHSGAARARQSAEIAAAIAGLEEVRCHAGAHFQGPLDQAYAGDPDGFNKNPEPYWNLAACQIKATDLELAELGEVVWVFSHGFYMEAAEPGRPCPDPGGFLIRRCLH